MALCRLLKRLKRMAKKKTFENIISNLLGEPVCNLCHAFYDQYVEANVKFRSKAGMKEVIIRRQLGKCCKWCADLAGIYTPENAPDDIYRRHDNCKCMVTYKDEDGYTDVWSKKEYESQKEARSTRAHEILNRRDSIVMDRVSYVTLETGAYNNVNDPYFKKREKIAKKLYEEIRNRKREYEIIAVANNSGFSTEEIDIVFSHIFEKEHLFEDGTVRKFDPGYYMAHSWMRLREGKNIQQHDIILLHHELEEAKIMNKDLAIPYEKAHNIVNEKWNYSSALSKYLENHEA